MFHKIVVQKIETHILCSKTFVRKSFHLWDNVQKYCGARQATEDVIAHAHYMLDTQGYKHTLRIRSTYCLSTATMVARTRHDVTLYVLYIASIVFSTYRVIQEESAILWEMIVCVILSKKVHMNVGPILNGYRDMVKRRCGPKEKSFCVTL
jgi:hypothetical protein